MPFSSSTVSKALLIALCAVPMIASAETVSDDAAGCADQCHDSSIFSPSDDGCGETCGESLFGCIEPLSSSESLGDWGDCSRQLGDSGVKVNGTVSQFYMGVVEGGLDQSGRYAGHGDYVALLDGDKLFGMPGFFVKLRAEHRFGSSMRGTTGALLPSALATDLPVPDSEQVYLTNVLFTQMFSETFGVFAGKLDTLDGDKNAFAGGRGITQFSNVGFIASPISLRTVPYSTLGAGFVVLQDLEPIFTFTVLNARETIRTTGISELFDDGVVIAPELRVPTNFFGRPGHQLFGGTWSSRNYVSLDQDPRIILPSIPIARQSDSWSLYYNFDQFLVVDPNDSTRGWGVFGRAGIADAQTNPIASFLSAGVGGSSIIPGRQQDTFGAGYYYSETSSDLAPALSAAIGGVGDGHGTEVFYNVAVTRFFNLTADAQFITPARETVDSSVLLGLRGVVSF